MNRFFLGEFRGWVRKKVAEGREDVMFRLFTECINSIDEAESVKEEMKRDMAADLALIVEEINMQKKTTAATVDKEKTSIMSILP